MRGKTQTRALIFFLALIPLLVGVSGCAKLMGSLRRDLDDSEPFAPPPITGGIWQERGTLDEDRYRAIGHSERSPAGLTEGGPVALPADDGVRFSDQPNVETPSRAAYKNGQRATRADFIDESPNEGSLWASNGQTNYYFTKNKIRGVGDIITVTVEEGLVKDIGLEVRRTLAPFEREQELMLAQERLKMKMLGLDPEKAGTQAGKDAIATSAAAAEKKTPKKDANGDDIETAEPREANFSDVEIGKSLEIKAGDTMMGEIVERYPNGNYKIRAVKKINYRNGPPRLMTLVGVARSGDIGEDDIVSSGKLYEYRLEATR